MGGAARSSLLPVVARRICFAASLVSLSAPALAAEGAHGLDGASLGMVWALPFVGILLSIALGPLLAPRFWHHHFGKVALAWALAFLVPFAAIEGLPAVAPPLAEALLHDYIPFVILLGALFTIAGGVLVTGNLHGSPRTNLALLGIGTLLASVIGTTGASMVMIRPLIRANDGRRHNVHVIVFFIFLVSNIGGSLTPIGDPPLFLGYLRGIGFFWTTLHMLAEAGFAILVLLALFYAIDRRLYRRDDDFRGLADPTPDTGRLGLGGIVNLVLLLVVVGAVLLSGSWKPGIAFHVMGVDVELQNTTRDVLLILAGLASLWLTPEGLRQRNGFEWGPIVEVAKLFAGIFVTIIPVLAMLRAAHDGAFAPLIGLVTAADGTPVNAMYFWATGFLSSFLDNAPTYLVFFNLAGGDPTRLMGDMAGTLVAISAGAVFMGANTYIGNAPNFMVKSIAERSGIHMPSFFGYMAWSAGILLPLFLITTLIFFG
ncbi:sodium:proton antiporter [Pleomorphomonas diazotrophica]|uniref:Sodium:proton antiporter n=1 Tax=Pleomorphomonas diazotrophica TaxID=1166257 RepID=A0A1I4SS91_9HYPH|nr:sodium:proton antiporter [Pleomorphomonas diazotrophica]PKR88498.1 sodium:proton antiporter [Pleomorphomonas diazotrophica]SFM67302.1 Na+/H+ antiporter NhaD [Pleomorphomonas diazotrophica]